MADPESAPYPALIHPRCDILLECIVRAGAGQDPPSAHARPMELPRRQATITVGVLAVLADDGGALLGRVTRLAASEPVCRQLVSARLQGRGRGVETMGRWGDEEMDVPLEVSGDCRGSTPLVFIRPARLALRYEAAYTGWAC